MNLDKLTKHIHLDTAEDFVNAISLRGPYLKPAQPPSVWIFRGHPRSTFKLVPSALRPIPHVCFSRFEPVRNKNLSVREHPRIPWEFDSLANFFREADAVGLPLPEDTQILRRDLGENDGSLLKDVYDGKVNWPPDHLLSLLGLAQHYGVKTRLLDWSRNPFVAGYFAASEAAANPDTESTDPRDHRLAVWAYNPTIYESVTLRHTSKPVVFVTAPTAVIPNLHAQQGLFTLYRPSSRWDPSADVEARPLNEVLYDTVDIKDSQVIFHFYHFTAPVSEAGKILWLLAQERITAAQIFPGYGGVVQALSERKLWERAVPIGYRTPDAGL